MDMSDRLLVKTAQPNPVTMENRETNPVGWPTSLHGPPKALWKVG